MSVLRHEVRPGAYADSVVLMQLQAGLAALDGVLDAAAVMATPTNLELLGAGGLEPEADTGAGPDDLLLVVRAESDEAAAAALARVDELLSRRRESADDAYRPKSLDGAARLLPEARWVLVSVPGRYAAEVARQALELDRHVFLYSDNVPLEDEVELKRAAAEKGLLVMGPDCGTAIVGGVGLGFANRVRRGGVGVVAASGTGLQMVASRIHALGGGVSQALGTGGRDLSAEVGGATARQALDLLGRDPETAVIVLISKPPAPEVAVRLLAAARATGKPVVVHFIGYPRPAGVTGRLFFSPSLGQTATVAVSLLKKVETSGRASTKRGSARPAKGHLRALFAGGTLALEAQQALGAWIAPLWSNVPILGARELPDPARSRDHTVLDLGADEYTVGRLHPMIDQELRLRRLRQEAEDPETGLLMLDVVLGEGAHPDPAAELAPAIEEIRAEREIEVVALLVGTDEDPQDLAAQRERLSAAGATVFENPSKAFVHLAERLAAEAPEPPPEVRAEALAAPPAAINVGLESFYESLREQGAEAVQVDWRPPAGGDERLQAILAKLKE